MSQDKSECQTTRLVPKPVVKEGNFEAFRVSPGRTHTGSPQWPSGVCIKEKVDLRKALIEGMWGGRKEAAEWTVASVRTWDPKFREARERLLFQYRYDPEMIDPVLNATELWFERGVHCQLSLCAVEQVSQLGVR